MNLTEAFNLCQTRLEKTFSYYLEQQTPAPLLQKAMAYSVYNGGKRIRPTLVYLAHTLFDAPLTNCDAPACAIEFIHTYSLIHDDLPAMDNSDLRRGKPSNHKMFDEATAILAGDTLQPLAFEILASHPCDLKNDQRINMIKILAQASGLSGMTAGQTLDILGVKNADELIQMYQLKTGALLNASLQLGAIAGNVQDKNLLQGLEKFAASIGLAFQIQDDLLDIQDNALTGKPKGIDIANNKLTYPILFGVEKTIEKISELTQAALESIKPLGKKADILNEVADYLMKRKM